MNRTALFLLLSLLVLAACVGTSSETAVATGVASTLEAQVVQTAVVATQRALDTPTPEPEVLCYVEAEEYLNSLIGLSDRWFDAVEIADSTSRIALSGPVGELQAIRREIGVVEGPDCAAKAGLALYNHTDHVIDGFLLFMQEEPDSTIEAAFDEAGVWIEKYYKELDTLLAETIKATREAHEATREAEATPTKTN